MIAANHALDLDEGKLFILKVLELGLSLEFIAIWLMSDAAKNLVS